MNYVEITTDLCKGCSVCVSNCPKQCLSIGSVLNKMGYQHVQFNAEAGCTACGLCFYVCPEPGVLTVHKDYDEGKNGKGASDE